jgi:hypothetical protein
MVSHAAVHIWERRNECLQLVSFLYEFMCRNLFVCNMFPWICSIPVEAPWVQCTSSATVRATSKTRHPWGPAGSRLDSSHLVPWIHGHDGFGWGRPAVMSFRHHRSTPLPLIPADCNLGRAGSFPTLFSSFGQCLHSWSLLSCWGMKTSSNVSQLCGAIVNRSARKRRLVAWCTCHWAADPTQSLLWDGWVGPPHLASVHILSSIPWP